MKNSAARRVVTATATAALAFGGLSAVGAPAQAATSQPYFTYANGWRTTLHQRELADVNGDGRADVVGFGSGGTYVSLGRADRTVSPPVKVLNDFGYDQGWRVGTHPRLLGDVNADGRADIVGFGYSGTYVSYGRSNGSFTAPVLAFRDMGVAQGWKTGVHQRALGDINGDGVGDIVGFGAGGVSVAYGKPGGGFIEPGLVLGAFGAAQGWTENRTPRLLEDVTGDGIADIVGFGDAGTYVAPGQPVEAFGEPVLAVRDFGVAQGWSAAQHPRTVADLDGDGIGDIVGFGYSGTFVAYGRGGESFDLPARKFQDFGVAQGWSAPQYQRTVGDANGDGTDDIVGFGYSGTYVAYGQSDKSVVAPSLWLRQFGLKQGWRTDLYPREVADVNGDGHADVVGFGHSQLLIESL